MVSLISLIILVSDDAKSVPKLIKTAKRIRDIKEIIVVNQSSNRDIYNTAKRLGAEVIYQSFHGYPRRGVSMRDGFYFSTGEVIMYLDADIGVVDEKVLSEIYSPILSSEADYVRGVVSKESNKLINESIRSLLKYLYPEIAGFSQYLSKIQAGLRKIFETVEWDLGWGAEILILINTLKHSLRVIEKDLGLKIREVKSSEINSDVAYELIETIIKKALRDKKIKENEAEELLNKYKLLIKEKIS
ncbi:MAG: glycosyltransferase [Sulfolobales archaeon]